MNLLAVSLLSPFIMIVNIFEITYMIFYHNLTLKTKARLLQLLLSFTIYNTYNYIIL